MDQANLVCVHETWIAHHIAPVSKVDREHCAASITNRAVAVIVDSFIAMRGYVPARKNRFEMAQKLRVNRYYVFKVTVRSAILNHENSAISLDDRGLDFPYALIQESLYRFSTIHNLLTRLAYTQWTKRVSLSRPAKRWLCFLPGL
jgi:hypothetical protein